jgi:RHS repeat-associated protein
MMLSPSPTPEEIFLKRLFEEPLVPIGGDPTPAENVALRVALAGYSDRTNPDDFSSITGFVDVYPNSYWNPALLTNLGLEYYNSGYYSKALTAWTRAWELSSRAAVDLRGKVLADRAVGELASMYARLGRMTELESLLESIQDRVFSGPATERITGAREGLSNMQIRPEIAFRCGPLALDRIMLSLGSASPASELMHFTASTESGFSLRHLEELSRELGLYLRMVFREKGAAFVVPSVVHLKLDHYAALIEQEGNRYLLRDPTFGNDAWVTAEVLESETSGYCLIPRGGLAADWRDVEAREGERVWGRGNTTSNDPDPIGACDPQTPGDSCREAHICAGMAFPAVHLMAVSLNISDVPVGYSPPVGPAVRFMVRYNQRDARQPANFNYSNLGPKWTFGWLSYITDNPSNPRADVFEYMMGGGRRTFTGFNSATQSYMFQQFDQTKLTRASPDTYDMLSPDGTMKVFSRSDGATGTARNIFLTQLIDPFGNAVSLTYDASLRVVEITDAIGQATTISYEHPTDIFKITRVTDPFGRSARFEYDPSNRLVVITDVAGITSALGYNGPAGDFITTLTTPYGITGFTKTESGTTRSLETVYPDGNRDRVEFNQSTNLGIPGSDVPQGVPVGLTTRNEFLFFRNTFYWDKMACAYTYGDYTKARIYHWLHTTNTAVTAGILESVKEPLEGRVWYDYPGQSLGPIFVGSSNKPSHIGRVLDDGSTQLYTYEYNSFGNNTRLIDPVGRTFSYLYAENGIDLLEIRQIRAGQNQLISKMAYGDHHLRTSSTDAAGRTTTYTYNGCGQIQTQTNAKNETITYQYDAEGYLTSIEGPLPQASTSFTYDAYGRMRTSTDVAGYTLTYDYDDLDRVTRITYPDSTFEEFTYERLDVTVIRDRAGRKISFEYNNLRQVTKQTDALSREILFQWCKCGDLRTLTDPLGRATTWRHDVQGRVQCKEYVDGSKITYLYENTSSRLRHRIDEKLQVTQYNYYPDDTVREISYPNALVATPAVTFAYDPNYGRLMSMTDGMGTTSYSYLPITPTPSLGAGRLGSMNGPLPTDTITFGYDELGRRVSTAINGIVSTVTHDAAGRVTSAANGLGTFTYTYDGDSPRVASQTFPNGQTAKFDYSGSLRDHVLERITFRSGERPISEFAYEHDVPTGKIISWSQQFGANAPVVYGFRYDPAEQLVAALVSEAGEVRNASSYSYDRANNRVAEEVGATSRRFFYNALNELTSVEGEGGLVARYRWDAEQRLASVIIGDLVTEFTYDGFGRRSGIRQLVKGNEVSNRRFLWCDDEIREERAVGGKVSKRFFTQGVKNEAGVKSGNFYYTRDHLGSIREVTDSESTVVARYSYDPFGRRRLLTGEFEADFGFAGMFLLHDVELDLTRFRIYSPHIGRWLSRDPLINAEIEESHNLFCYVRNDPVNAIDPLGLTLCCPNGLEHDRTCAKKAEAELVRCILDVSGLDPGDYRNYRVSACQKAHQKALSACPLRCLPFR